MNLQIEFDMLQGNINLLCITNDLDELSSISKWAHKRIYDIYEYRKEILMECAKVIEDIYD